MSKGGGGGGAGGSIFDQAAGLLSKAGTGTANAYNNFAALSGYNPALAHVSNANASGAGLGASGGAAVVGQPSLISEGISRYMNPYEDQVVGAATGDINRLAQIQQTQNAGAAAAAGAFGGSRHGLVEAETNRAAQDTLSSLVGNLRQGGWNTAATLSGQDIANKTGVDAENASILNNLAAFNATAKNQASQFGGTQQLAGAQGMLSAAGQAGQLGAGGVDIGRSLNSDLASAGGAQQSVLQQIIDAAKGNFQGFTGQGNTLLNTLASAITGSPLSNAGTTTQSYSPGLFDYLSLAAQTAGNLYNPTGGSTSKGKK